MFDENIPGGRFAIHINDREKQHQRSIKLQTAFTFAIWFVCEKTKP